MPKRRNRTHSNEFREEAVRQVRESGKPLSRMALELGINYATLRSWAQQAESPPGERQTRGAADASSGISRAGPPAFSRDD